MSTVSINVKEKIEGNNGHVWFQWLVAFLANIPVFTYGLQAGWVSPIAPILQSNNSPLGEPVSDAALSWIASVMFLTAAFSPPAYSYIADRFGRRVACVLISVPHTVTWLMTLFAKNVAVLIAARALSGIAAGGVFCITPMFVKELSEDRVRGRTGSLGMIVQSGGFLAVYLMGAFMDYYTIIYAAIALPILHIVLSIFIPESPSYLVKVARYEDASKNIAWLRGLNVNDTGVVSEVNKLKSECESKHNMERLSVRSVLSNKAWRKGVKISLVLHGVRGMGGSLVILSYASTILERAGVTAVNRLVQTTTIPAVMILGTVVSLLIVDKFGRKPLLILGCSVMCISLVMLGVVTHLGPFSDSWSWLPIVALVAAIFGFGVGVLSIPYIIMSEIFNVQVRATLLGYIAVYIWIIVFIHVQTFSYISNSLGIYTVCYIYAAINLVGVVYSVFCVPETKGTSIEEIEKMFEK